MTAPARLFIETIHHAALRYGGWGIAWEAGGAVTGVAGGERNTTAARIDLMGLIAALDGLPAGPASIHSASPGVLRVARLLAAPPEAVPEIDPGNFGTAVALLSGLVVLIRSKRSRQ